MNIYTVTFIGRNYGSVLQAFALQSCLKEMGVKPCVLLEKARSHSKLYINLSEFVHLFVPKPNYNFKKRFLLFLDNYKFVDKNIKIDKFIKNNITTRTIIDKESFIRKEINESDIFLAGSDQIWNECQPVSPWYSLQWVRDIKKYSYAASLGKTELSESQVLSYAESLSEFEIVSLREWQAADRLKEVFVGKIRHDIDPTLLYEGTFWKKIASQRLIKEPYIFVYRLRPNDDIFHLARKVANERGRRIVYTGLCGSHMKDIYTIYDAGIEDFLSLILYADVVITNSFHGTVFSILFEKPFLSVEIATTGARVNNLLSMLNLRSQLINGNDKGYSLNIDYQMVNGILSQKRKNSLDYLKDICRK